MKNILFVLPDLDCGGAQRVILTLASEVLKRGDKVTLIVFRKGGKLFSEVEEGIEVISLAGNKVSGFYLGLQALVKLAMILGKLKPKAIISSLTGANIVSILASKLVRYKGVLIIRHENTRIDKEGAPKRYALKRLYTWADGVVVVSKEVGKELEEISPNLKKNNKVKVINNPVDIKQIRVRASELTGVDWIDSKRFRIVMAVGRLEEQKDYPTLLRAFWKMRTRSDTRLVILGEGALHQPLKLLAEELGISQQVHFAGVVTNPYAWMVKCDVFVMSSRWEGQPVVLIEALSLGLNIVSTDCRSGPREVLEGGKLGVLVPVGNYIMLCKAIEKNLERKFKSPREQVESMDIYSPQTAVRKHFELLEL